MKALLVAIAMALPVAASDVPDQPAGVVVPAKGEAYCYTAKGGYCVVRLKDLQESERAMALAAKLIRGCAAPRSL